MPPPQRIESSRRQRLTHLPRNRRAQLTLEREDVPRLVLVRTRPDRRLIRGAKQAGCDADAAVVRVDGARDEIIDAKLLGDLRQRPFRLPGRQRSSRDDFDVLGIHLPERGDRFLVQSTGQVGVAAVEANRLEGQDRKHDP
jgi:hypothetical protein